MKITEDVVKGFLLFFVSLLFAVVCFGQTGVSIPVEVVPPSPEEVFAFFQALSGWKGLGGLALAGIAVQGLLLFFRSQFAPLSNLLKLAVVGSLSLVAGVLAMLIAGVPLLEALFHSSTLSAYMVLINQWVKALKND